MRRENLRKGDKHDTESGLDLAHVAFQGVMLKYGILSNPTSSGISAVNWETGRDGNTEEGSFPRLGHRGTSRA